MRYKGTYGALIKEARDEEGYSQEELAAALRKLLPERPGIDNTAVSRWEAQARRPSIEEGNALVTALSLNAERFWRAMGVVMATRTKDDLPDKLVTLLLSLDSRELGPVELVARGQLALRRQEGREA